MIRTLVKLAFVALLANATWHVFSVYLPHYKFKDSVTETAQFSNQKTDSQLRERILELASQFDVPVTDENLTVRRVEHHTIIDTSYTRPVDLLPGFTYQWPFTMHIDVITIPPVQLHNSGGVPK